MFDAYNVHRDPTVFSNYVIFASAVDPKRGKTPEEVKKYTMQRIAAIAIKVFLALITGGLSALVNLGIVAEREEAYKDKIVDAAKVKLNYNGYIQTHHISQMVHEARFKAKLARATENTDTDWMYAEKACWGFFNNHHSLGAPSKDDIKVVAEALYQVRANISKV